MKKINLKREISPYLAFPLMLIFSFLLAFFMVSKAQEIVERSKEAPVFNLEKRMEKQVPKNETASELKN